MLDTKLRRLCTRSTELRGTVSATNPFALVSPPESPRYARLLIGDVHYEAVEFSAAGLSLHRWAARKGKLGTFTRGDECDATLCIGGLGWEEMYDVVLRFAVRGPKHLGLAFVSLPPVARQVLMRTQDESEVEDSMPDDKFGYASRVPFAFGKLLDERAPQRRLILSTSASVFTHTLARSRENGVPPQRGGAPPPVDMRRYSARASYAGRSRPAGTLFVYGVALFAVVVLLLGVLFG